MIHKHNGMFAVQLETKFGKITLRLRDKKFINEIRCKDVAAFTWMTIGYFQRVAMEM
jgi:tRNA threonylcarbamoyladenosine modification (KEOPS) complex  Pcc1 subunit